MAQLLRLTDSALVGESGVFPRGHYPTCIFMLIYHLVDEQYARFWLQFRDAISPHRHDHHKQNYGEYKDYKMSPICT
jgi:hypothetical protein